MSTPETHAMLLSGTYPLGHASSRVFRFGLGKNWLSIASCVLQPIPPRGPQQLRPTHALYGCGWEGGPHDQAAPGADKAIPLGQGRIS
jgi:hypothetical protein